MPSIFHRARFSIRTPLTSLFLEHFSLELTKLTPEEREDQFVEVLARCMEECGLSEGPPSDDQLIEIADRLNQVVPTEETEDGQTLRGGSHFSGYFIEWSGKLRADGLCLYLADYDYPRANRLYCELDQQLVVAIASEKLRLEFERARVAFEAALFGFGGSYKGSPQGDEKVFDLTKDNAAAEVALKNFGF
jgi:hypothetical protein